MGDLSASEGKVVHHNHWPTVLFQIYLHICAVYGLALVITKASFCTSLFCLLLITLGMLGTNLGAHRLWAHEMYKASFLLRVFLGLCQTLTCQCSILNWVVHHKVHHKYHGTESDPSNYKRGMFFCHLASRCLENNPEIDRLKRHIPVDELEEDYVVYIQHWFYYLIMPAFGILLPIIIGTEYIGETPFVAIFVLGFLRICVLLHTSWLIESGYILWGLDPTDRRASDTWLVFFVTKSLWPQYHYMITWDYRSGEFGTYDSGFTTAVLRVFAAIGMATQLTTMSSNGVKKALAKSSETDRSLAECLLDYKFVLPDIINQNPDNN